MMDFYFYQSQPLFATPVDIITEVSFVSPSPTEIPIVTYTVPPQYEGVIKFVGQDSSQPLIFNNSSWFVRIDGNPATNWANVDVQKGSIINPTPDTIILSSQQTVQISAIVATGTGITFPVILAGRLKGWIWGVERRRVGA